MARLRHLVQAAWENLTFKEVQEGNHKDVSHAWEMQGVIAIVM